MNIFHFLLSCFFVFAHCLFIEYSKSARNSKAILSITLVSALIWTALTIMYFGVGNYWSIRILLLKALSLFVSLLVPFVLASTPYLIKTHYEMLERWKLILSIVFGVIGVSLSPFIALFLSCISTGDCI